MYVFCLFNSSAECRSLVAKALANIFKLFSDISGPNFAGIVDDNTMWYNNNNQTTQNGEGEMG